MIKININAYLMKIINSFVFIRRFGFKNFLFELYLRSCDLFCEFYFNVNTRRGLTCEALGTDINHSRDYSYLSYKHITKLLDAIPFSNEEISILDYGCGKGRVLVCSASRPYKRVLGVEVSLLFDVAKKNVERIKRRKAKEIDVVKGDASDFVIPPDLNVFFFFNPFVGQTLESVVERIRVSLLETPRDIFIIYVNNDSFDKLLAGKDWIHKKCQSHLFLNINYGLYQTCQHQE